ncbi:unnamed protein product [Urochloa decumbens]|uniref:Rx N-terminal domain-containing protein n=1 Tax=Urochloa decumbens TaxID=240449 RepID=A0ABC9FM24_9POAL
MAEMVSSAVVQETVSQILSGLVHKCEGKEKSSANENMERLEMAHIRLGAALETSDKWKITDASLLRWRRKLKHVAQECGDSLQKCKQRILEDEEIQKEVRKSSFPKRIAHSTTSFVYSIFSCNNDELDRSIVRRFEWFADGASEFVRLVELGGTPHGHMPFHSFIKQLFAGKALQHKIVQGNDYPLFLLWLVPFNTTEHGTQANLMFTQKDDTSPEGNIYFSMTLQLSESTDIVGITIKCLELFAPHFKCTIEKMRKELSQLPTQDLSWVPLPTSAQEYRHSQHNLQILCSQWFRQDPLCCKHHDGHDVRQNSNIYMAGLSDIFLEPILEVTLQCQVSMSLYNKQNTLVSEDIISLQDSQYLKAGISFAPHRSSEDMLHGNISSAIVAIVGEEQHCLDIDITLAQLEKIMLPKAIDYFHRNAKAAIYKMIWKSKHGSALIQVEKTSMSTRRALGGARKRKMLQGQDEEIRSWTCMITHLIDLWHAHVPTQLRNAIMDWLQKVIRSTAATSENIIYIM